VLGPSPRDLPYSPDQPLPKLGGLFIKKGIWAMMADGGTRWLRRISMKNDSRHDHLERR